jgi:hypothetical protein
MNSEESFKEINIRLSALEKKVKYTSSVNIIYALSVLIVACSIAVYFFTNSISNSNLKNAEAANILMQNKGLEVKPSSIDWSDLDK